MCLFGSTLDVRSASPRCSHSVIVAGWRSASAAASRRFAPEAMAVMMISWTAGVSFDGLPMGYFSSIQVLPRQIARIDGTETPCERAMLLSVSPWLRRRLIS